jgi:putative peptidoglycan lipid II flippase
MLPIAVGAAILRTEAVALLFGGFEPGANELTAATLLAFLVGLVAHSAIAVLARAFYARQDTLTPVVAAVGAVVINTTLAAALVGPLGLPGIALAIAIAAWIEAGVLVLLLRRREGPLGLGAVASVAVRTALATTMAGALGVIVHGLVGPALAPDPASIGRAGIPGLAAVLAIVGGTFSLAFVGASLVLRIDDLRSIVGIMVDALRRPRRSS